MNEVKPRPGANVPEAGCKFLANAFFPYTALTKKKERKKERRKKERKPRHLSNVFFTSRSKMKFFTGLDSCRNNDANEETKQHKRKRN